jgi:SH3-like domain-containing protein
VKLWRYTPLSTDNKLEKQVQQLQHTKPARVRTTTADLKVAPYTESKTLQQLAQGNTVTVLAQIPGWYRVQSSDGRQGWVYELMLEFAP